ncbi:Imm63 family immunity protein [Streptomyces kanasensis]|uniref:Imm63 family immunity protein n=1 Tax=Streptomyces kanasensis TaxID=936756 RepID=UPI0036F9AA34
MTDDERAATCGYLEGEMARLGRLAGIAPGGLPGFTPCDGACPFIEVGADGELRYLAYERGRKVLERVTHDPEDVLYWAFQDVTFEAAGVWARSRPQDGEPFRVTLWRRQFALLHTLRPAWARRRRADLIASFRDPDDVRLVPELPPPAPPVP